MTAETTDRPRTHGHPAVPSSRVDYGQRPMLVFWETTRACQVACRHCRASALTTPLPGELSVAEGRNLIDQVAGFGRPHPILVLTGGDCLLRRDLFELVDYATALGVLGQHVGVVRRGGLITTETSECGGDCDVSHPSRRSPCPTLMLV